MTNIERSRSRARSGGKPNLWLPSCQELAEAWLVVIKVAEKSSRSAGANQDLPRLCLSNNKQAWSGLKWIWKESMSPKGWSWEATRVMHLPFPYHMASFRSQERLGLHVCVEGSQIRVPGVNTCLHKDGTTCGFVLWCREWLFLQRVLKTGHCEPLSGSSSGPGCQTLLTGPKKDLLDGSKKMQRGGENDLKDSYGVW